MESVAEQNNRPQKSGAPYPEDRGPASFRRQLENVKGHVRIEAVAQDYGDFKLAGGDRLLGRCLAPDHEDKTPSLTIFTEDQRFKCFGIGCDAHGDVLDLVQLAEGCELWEAMMILSTRYGIALPERPAAWFRKQERQAATRQALEDAKIAHLQRRVFRRFMALLEAIEDDQERKAEAEHLWEAAREIAVLIWAGRRAA